MRALRSIIREHIHFIVVVSLLTLMTIFPFRLMIPGVCQRIQPSTLFQLSWLCVTLKLNLSSPSMRSA